MSCCRINYSNNDLQLTYQPLQHLPHNEISSIYLLHLTNLPRPFIKSFEKGKLSKLIIISFLQHKVWISLYFPCHVLFRDLQSTNKRCRLICIYLVENVISRSRHLSWSIWLNVTWYGNFWQTYLSNPLKSSIWW